MDNNQIEVGDLVIITWSDGERLSAVVLYVPVAAGDSWRVRSTNHDQRLMCIQQFETMVLIEKGKPFETMELIEKGKPTEDKVEPVAGETWYSPNLFCAQCGAQLPDSRLHFDHLIRGLRIGSRPVVCEKCRTQLREVFEVRSIRRHPGPDTEITPQVRAKFEAGVHVCPECGDEHQFHSEDEDEDGSKTPVAGVSIWPTPSAREAHTAIERCPKCGVRWSYVFRAPGGGQIRNERKANG